MSIINSPNNQLGHDSKLLRFTKSAGILLLGIVLAVMIAYLLTHDKVVYVLLLIAAPVLVLLLHRYPFVSISVWLLLTPFLNHTNTYSERLVYWGIHRVLPPATLIVIMVAGILKIYRHRLPKLGFAEWSMIGYVVISGLSIFLLNPKPQATFYQFYDRVISPMCLYLIVRLSSPAQKDIQKLWPVLLFVAVSQSIFGLLSWISPGVLPKEWLDKVGQRTTGSLVNTTVYTATLIFCGLFLLHSALSQRSPRGVRNLLLSAFALTLSLVFLSFSRASWIGGIVVLIGVAIIYPRFTTIFATVILFIYLFFGAVSLTRFSWIADQANQRLYSQEAENSAFSRLPVFYAATRMFIEKPLFGWGYGNFDLYDRQFQAQVGPFVGDNKDHASHNFFLTLLSEQGAVGFFLFMGPVFYWLTRTTKWKKMVGATGFGNTKLPILLWLAILNEIILINFSNLRVFFGWGVWWIALGLIAAMVHPAPVNMDILNKKITR